MEIISCSFGDCSCVSVIPFTHCKEHLHIVTNDPTEISRITTAYKSIDITMNVPEYNPNETKDTMLCYWKKERDLQEVIKLRKDACKLFVDPSSPIFEKLTNVQQEDIKGHILCIECLENLLIYLRESNRKRKKALRKLVEKEEKTEESKKIVFNLLEDEKATISFSKPVKERIVPYIDPKDMNAWEEAIKMYGKTREWKIAEFLEARFLHTGSFVRFTAEVYTFVLRARDMLYFMDSDVFEEKRKNFSNGLYRGLCEYKKIAQENLMAHADTSVKQWNRDRTNVRLDAHNTDTIRPLLNMTRHELVKFSADVKKGIFFSIIATLFNYINLSKTIGQIWHDVVLLLNRFSRENAKKLSYALFNNLGTIVKFSVLYSKSLKSHLEYLDNINMLNKDIAVFVRGALSDSIHIFEGCVVLTRVLEVFLEHLNPKLWKYYINTSIRKTFIELIERLKGTMDSEEIFGIYDYRSVNEIYKR